LIGYEPNAKSYRCYHRSSKQVFSSYHVRFIEAYEGPSPSSPDPPALPCPPLGSDTLSRQDATPASNCNQDTDHPFSVQAIPFHLPPTNDVSLDIHDPGALNIAIPPPTNPHDDQPDPDFGPPPPVPPVLPTQPPLSDEPRRSTRLAAKRIDLAVGVTRLSRLEEAIQQSRDSATSVAQNRLLRKTDKQPTQPASLPVTDTDPVLKLCDALNSLHLDHPYDETEVDRLDRILAVMASVPNTDFSNFDLDEPKTWQEAKASSYGPQWEAG
jgi:hypothetical protein